MITKYTIMKIVKMLDCKKTVDYDKSNPLRYSSYLFILNLVLFARTPHRHGLGILLS